MINLEALENLWVLRLDSGENRFHPALNDALLDALSKAKAAPKPVIVTGTGKFFSNGLDLTALTADGPGLLRGVERVLARLLTFPAITVAAINGHAFGAGSILAAACDFRLMREDRGFLCYPEVDLGLTLSEGFEALVTSKVPKAALHEALLTGRRYGGADAKRLGLVDAVASETELMPRAVQLGAELASKDGSIVAALRKQIDERAIEVLSKA